MGDQHGPRSTVARVQRNQTIADLNDNVRRQTGLGVLLVTAGVLALGEGALSDILTMVCEFDDFDTDNDPHGEHDFGAFSYRGARIFWKIDYYGLDLRSGSPDPADPAVTTRTLMVMLASEY